MIYFKKFLETLDPRMRWVFLLLSAVSVVVWLGLVPLARHWEETEQEFYSNKAKQLLDLAIATNRYPLQEGLEGFTDLKMLEREPQVTHEALLNRQGVVLIPISSHNDLFPLSLVSQVMAGQSILEKISANHWRLGNAIRDANGTVLGGILFEFSYQSEVTRWMLGFLFLLLGVVAALGKICWPVISANSPEEIMIPSTPDWSWIETIEKASDKKVLLADAEGKIIASGEKIPKTVQHLFDLADARPELLWRALQEGHSLPGIQLIPWKGFFILCFD